MILLLAVVAFIVVAVYVLLFGSDSMAGSTPFYLPIDFAGELTGLSSSRRGFLGRGCDRLVRVDGGVFCRVNSPRKVKNL